MDKNEKWLEARGFEYCRVNGGGYAYVRQLRKSIGRTRTIIVEQNREYAGGWRARCKIHRMTLVGDECESPREALLRLADELNTENVNQIVALLDESRENTRFYREVLG